MSTLTDHIRRLEGSARVGLQFEDQRITSGEIFSAACARAAFIDSHVYDGPRHVGVLLPNVPESIFWLSGGLLAGATIVGLNSTRRGSELAADVQHTDCAFVVTDVEGAVLLDAAGVTAPRWVLGTAEYDQELAAHRDAPSPAVDVSDDVTAVLIFTSGTTSAPKAAIRTHGALAALAERFINSCAITADDVAYNAMPWFHSNALYHAVMPTLISQGTLVLRRRFSASQFITDVRRYDVTRFNYVGKVLEYILATPALPDDHDNPLRLASGSEASERDILGFSERFGVFVRDGFGSTEGGVTIMRTPEMPAGALGCGTDDTTVVMNPDTELECPPAVFDDAGRLTNGDEAVGELVNTAGPGLFEGYYANDEANATRTRRGWYWSGDLAYRDAAGYFYFAGRGYDWLRVDGENFAAAPIERILLRHTGVLVAAVYAVPDPNTGDQVMVTIQLSDDAVFDPRAFEEFLDGQVDLGTKWRPRFVRVTPAMPVSHTNKIQKPALRNEAWMTNEPVWWRRGSDKQYVEMTDGDVAELEQAFVRAGRSAFAPTTAGAVHR